MLFFGRSICRRHFFNLFPQLLDLRILFPQKTLLFLNLCGINNDLLPWDQLLIKVPLHIVRAIAIVDPLYKLKQDLQGHQRISRCDIPLRMDCKVSQPDHIRQLPPRLPIQRKAERRLMDQRLKVVLIRLLNRTVRRIHPLHRQLQSFPAPHRAHRRSRSINLLCLHRRRGKQGIFFFECQEAKV